MWKILDQYATMLLAAPVVELEVVLTHQLLPTVELLRDLHQNHLPRTLMTMVQVLKIQDQYVIQLMITKEMSLTHPRLIAGGLLKS